MLGFLVMIIIALILCYIGYLKFKNYFFPEKDGKRYYNKYKSQDKVDLKKNVNKKDNDIQEKIIDKNIINEKFQEFAKKLDVLEKENKKIKEKLNLTELKAKKVDVLEKENKKIKEELNLTDLNVMIQKQEINILKIKNNMFLNAYKILYYRKISNIILEIILNNNLKHFYRTDYVFKHKGEEKPGYKAKPFPIIVAKKKLGNFSINIINLLIDCLMYIKDFTSSFIHIVKKFPIQIEILFSIFGDYNIKIDDNNNYLIDASILINTVFGDQEKKDDIKENNKIFMVSVEEKTEDSKKKKEEDNNVVLKEIKDEIKEINKDIKVKDEDVKEKIEITNKKDNNKDINGKNNSSENGFTANEEKESEENSDITDNNNIIIINEEQIIKNNLITKIENIITKMKENNLNFSKNDIINEINELNTDKISENKLDKNELLKVQNIKKLRDIINKNKNSFTEGNLIDIYYIFEEWKKSFNKSYKADKNFKKLIIYDEKIELNDIKIVASYLLKKSNQEKIVIFGDDPGDFKNIGLETLKVSQFDGYLKEYE